MLLIHLQSGLRLYQPRQQTLNGASDNWSHCSLTHSQFLHTQEIIHKTSARYHPTTIAQAEQFVQILKFCLKSMDGVKASLVVKL